MTLSPDSLRVCIAGAGAIGTTLAVRLALGGHRVSVLARGDTLQAIRRQGLGLEDLEGSHRVQVQASDTADFGPQDVIFLCAKSQDLPTLAALSTPAIGPDSMIVPVVNGVPFWYFEGQGGRHQGRVVQAVDPEGRLKSLLPLSQLIGAITYVAAERVAPGVARTRNPLRMIIGEIDHRPSERLSRLGEALKISGLNTEISERIRDPLWTKVVANLISNPFSVVTGATLHEIFGNPNLAPLTRQLLDEAMLTAAAYGARVEMDADGFFAMGIRMGDVRTSMLQDFDKGLPLELAAIGDAVLELAGLQSLPMPFTHNILSLARYKSAKALHPEATR